MPANVQSMMYHGEVPWHGLGKKLDKAATAEEAIVAAGMDWTVKKVPTFLEGGRPSGHYSIVREDNDAILGHVGETFTSLQNKDKFKLFDAVVGVKEAIYHTAGVLGAGERVWILAKLPGELRIGGDDIVEKFVLLADGHDGSLSLVMMNTGIRVVCANTLQMALSGEEGRKKFKHTHSILSIGQDLDSIRSTLGIVHGQFAIMEQAARKLAAVQLTQEAFKSYCLKVGLAPKPREDGSESSKTLKIFEEVSRLFENGRGADLRTARGTAWGAFNAVVEYADYYRATKGDNKDDQRAKSVLFGTGQTLKQKAWDEALALTR